MVVEACCLIMDFRVFFPIQLISSAVSNFLFVSDNFDFFCVGTHERFLWIGGLEKRLKNSESTVKESPDIPRRHVFVNV